jgi:hypothetical protein
MTDLRFILVGDVLVQFEAYDWPMFGGVRQEGSPLSIAIPARRTTGRPTPQTVILRTWAMRLARYASTMKSRFSYAHAIAGAFLAFGLSEVSWFVQTARDCHDLSWGIAGLILGPAFALPIVAAAATLGWIAGGYVRPEKRRPIVLLACAIGVIAAIAVYGLTTPQIGACRMDM